MSASIDNTECPKCGGNALSEQDTETLEVHIHCTEPNCDYDSDDFDDDYIDDEDEDCTDCDVCDGMCGM